MDSASIAALRRDYSGRPLTEEVVGSDPIEAVRAWLQDAVRAEVKDPNAMTLATVDRSGDPDARVVLLKGIEDGTLVFYTNYRSAKGEQLLANPRATLVFFWPELERQIRVRGDVDPVDRTRSVAYFRSRPRESQLGAWASAQSAILPSREVLEARFRELEAAYPEGTEIPYPEHWGGFAVRPVEIELWQGRPSRLHDRLRAARNGRGWAWARLSP